MCLFSVFGLPFSHLKTDFLPLRHHRAHELANGIKDDLDLSIMLFYFPFQLCQRVRKLFMSREHFPKLDKYPYDGDVHLNRALTVQYT